MGCWVVCALPGTAAAQGAVERGRASFLEADFEGSQAAFEAAVQEEALGVADLTSALLHLSAIASLLGDDELARRHAQDALAMDADARAPEGAPASSQELLDSLRDAATPIALTLVVDRTRLDAPRVVARRDGGLHLATELVLVCAEAESVGEDEASLPLAPGVDRCEAVVQTEGGSVVAEEALSIASVAGPTEETETVLDDPGTDDSNLGLVLGVVGGVVAALAVGIALAFVLRSPGPPQLTGVTLE